MKRLLIAVLVCASLAGCTSDNRLREKLRGGTL